MSRGWKITIIVGVILLALCCVACLSAGVLGSYFASKSVSSEPEQAAKIGHEIADYTLPEGYVEVMGMSILSIKWVAIADLDEESEGLVIMMMQFPVNSSLSQEEMQKQMSDAFARQRQYNSSSFKMVGTQKATIRGQQVTLTVSEGQTEQGDTLRQMLGMFSGKNGTVMLMVMGSVEKWDQEILDAFTASIE